MAKEVIAVRGLEHVYKSGVKALNGVDLTVFENEQLSIVGQNGSGKTTLVRHFNGLLRPTAGSIALMGEPTEGLSAGKMAQSVGYVFQNPNHQIFCTTVREELEVAPKNFKIPKEEYDRSIDEVVELMGIGDLLDRRPLLLDYTTKKIITIASVLVVHPQVLILDEPTGGLDEPGRQLLSRVTELVRGQGHTVIMISHDMDYVAEHSERVVVMAGGKIIGDGTPQEIFSRQELMAQAQIEPPQITQLDAWLDGSEDNITLSVEGFIDKYKRRSASYENS